MTSGQVRRRRVDTPRDESSGSPEPILESSPTCHGPRSTHDRYRRRSLPPGRPGARYAGATAGHDDQREPGTEIAGYRIESLIGRGGMAVVYRAEDMRLGRKVALKLLTPQLADSEQFRQRFIRESRLAASLDHPNIVPIYEAGEADGQLFIAMRYVLGAT